MSADADWVPKVHPLHRGMETEDPLELMAAPAIGDPDVMLECLIQEFMSLGFAPDQLLDLFDDPGYPVLGALSTFFGRPEIERRVTSLIERGGWWRAREVFTEPEEADEPEHPALVQLTVHPSLFANKG